MFFFLLEIFPRMDIRASAKFAWEIYWFPISDGIFAPMPEYNLNLSLFYMET